MNEKNREPKDIQDKTEKTYGQGSEYSGKEGGTTGAQQSGKAGTEQYGTASEKTGEGYSHKDTETGSREHMGEEGKPGGYGENPGKPGEHKEGIPGQSHTYTQQGEKADEKYGETGKEMGKGPEGHKAPGMHPGGQVSPAEGSKKMEFDGDKGESQGHKELYGADKKEKGTDAMGTGKKGSK